MTCKVKETTTGETAIDLLIRCLDTVEDGPWKKQVSRISRISRISAADKLEE